MRANARQECQHHSLPQILYACQYNPPVRRLVCSINHHCILLLKLGLLEFGSFRNARFTNSGFSVCASSGRLKSQRMSTSRQTCCRGAGIPDFGRSNTGVSLAKPAETPETSPKKRTVRQNAPQVPKEIKRLIGICTFTV